MISWQPPLDGRLLPTSKPDTDNVLKAVLDGCNGVLWRDDVLVVDVRIRKRYAATPCVRVEAWQLAEPLGASPFVAPVSPQPDLLAACAP